MYTRTWDKKKLPVLGIKTAICSYLVNGSPCDLEESHDPQHQEFLRIRAEVLQKKQEKVASDSNKTLIIGKSELQMACGSRMCCSQFPWWSPV